MRVLRRFFRRFGWVHFVTLGLLGALIVLRVADPAPLQLLRSKVFDFYQQIEPRDQSKQPVAIIDLDEESLKEVGQWPWPRTTIAQLVNNARKMGAVGIAFDVVFAPAAAACAAAVFAASSIAAVVFHFLQCVRGVRSRRMVAEHTASRPSTNALTTYLDTSVRSPHAVESNL